MKFLYTIFIFTCLSISIFSQNIPYYANTELISYEDLSGSTTINGVEVWNSNYSTPVYFNFDFEILGQNYTSLNVLAGGIEFAGYGDKELMLIHTPFGGYFMKDRGSSLSESPISYLIEGQEGEKILKIEWKNAGFEEWAAEFDPDNDYTNFQIWLFEEDNHIEIHWGKSMSGYGDTFSDFIDPLFFIDDPFAFTFFGTADNPSYDYVDYSEPTYFMIDALPSEGIVYNLYPNLEYTNINHASSSSLFEIYPVPSNGLINIKSNRFDKSNYNIEVYDISGRLCYKSNLCKTESQVLDLSEYQTGEYLLYIQNSEGTIIETKKISIINQ